MIILDEIGETQKMVMMECGRFDREIHPIVFILLSRMNALEDFLVVC